MAVQFYEVGYRNYLGELKSGTVTHAGLIDLLQFIKWSETLTLAYVSKER